MHIVQWIPNIVNQLLLRARNFHEDAAYISRRNQVLVW